MNGKFIPTGFVFEAVLDTAIFSINLVTPVIAVLDEDIKYLSQVIFPRGARLIGDVSVVHSLDRVQIKFHTCVFPRGYEIPVKFMALSLDGSAGIKGKVETHKDELAARVAMKSIVSGVQAGAQLSPQTVEGAMALGLTQDALISLDSKKPTKVKSIWVDERTPIQVFNNKRLKF